MNARELMTAALEKVESKSIRAWATSERNFSIWLQIAGNACEVAKGYPDVNRFTAYIVCVAIGL